jgi:hypothetical protein
MLSRVVAEHGQKVAKQNFIDLKSPYSHSLKIFMHILTAGTAAGNVAGRRSRYLPVISP